MSDAEKLSGIIAGCKAGSAEGFSRLVDMYAGRCYGYFYRLSGDCTVSEDLLGDLFVKLVEKIGSYNGGNFDGWLFRVASNIFHDYLRSTQRQRAVIQAQKQRLSRESKQPKHSAAEQLDKLQRQLALLDSETRELILLRFYSQLSFREIAKMRGEPIGTTLSKVHRGLKKLRELMGA